MSRQLLVDAVICLFIVYLDYVDNIIRCHDTPVEHDVGRHRIKLRNSRNLGYPNLLHVKVF